LAADCGDADDGALEDADADFWDVDLSEFGSFDEGQSEGEGKEAKTRTYGRNGQAPWRCGSQWMPYVQ
jgi:hypothetical protein